MQNDKAKAIRIVEIDIDKPDLVIVLVGASESNIDDTIYDGKERAGEYPCVPKWLVDAERSLAL